MAMLVRVLRTGAIAVLFALGATAVRTDLPGSGPTAGVAHTHLAQNEVTYLVPVDGAVLVGFDPPATPYAAGHRGIDLAAAQGTRVIAAAAGSVEFAGPVAGRGVVVLRHADGLRTEYEPVQPSVRAGALVHGGDVIGVVAGRHASCAPASCLHWGARRGEVYLDPMTLLVPLGVVRLLPSDSG